LKRRTDIFWTINSFIFLSFVLLRSGYLLLTILNRGQEIHNVDFDVIDNYRTVGD